MTDKIRHKDFGSPVQNLNGNRPSFDLYGETFTCYHTIQGKALAEFIIKVDSEKSGQAAQGLLDVIKIILLPESYERFDTLVTDPERIVPIETLVEIVNWAISSFTARPTQPPTPSSGGRKKSGRISGEKVSSLDLVTSTP